MRGGENYRSENSIHKLENEMRGIIHATVKAEGYSEMVTYVVFNRDFFEWRFVIWKIL